MMMMWGNITVIMLMLNTAMKMRMMMSDEDDDGCAFLFADAGDTLTEQVPAVTANVPYPAVTA